ncbi:MAG: hypothetical protein KAI83_20230 [Thiomargarita sp.]|nr:hypothetical protein [Thiomargarita sp.]
MDHIIETFDFSDYSISEVLAEYTATPSGRIVCGIPCDRTVEFEMAICDAIATCEPLAHFAKRAIERWEDEQLKANHNSETSCEAANDNNYVVTAQYLHQYVGKHKHNLNQSEWLADEPVCTQYHSKTSMERTS